MWKPKDMYQMIWITRGQLFFPIYLSKESTLKSYTVILEFINLTMFLFRV